MECHYGFEFRSSGCLNPREMVSDVSQQIVFVALDRKKINLWVLGEGNDVQFKQKEIQDQDAAIFFKGLREKAFKENDIAVPRKCEDRPSFGQEMNRRLLQYPVNRQ